MQPECQPGRRHVASIAICLLLPFAATLQAQVERISLAGDGSQANADSYQPAVSDDGNVIAFRSNADNLVAGDSNNWTDVFVRDLGPGTTERVSLQPNGSESSSFSNRPSLSGDGRIVVFESPNPVSWVLVTAVTDRQAGSTVHLLPRDQSGNPAEPKLARLEPVISGDGRFIAFRSRDQFQDAYPTDVRPVDDDGNGTLDVFVYDFDTQPTPRLRRVSRLTTDDELDADSLRPAISADGSLVAFMTYSELVVNDANSRPDIVLKDSQSGVLELISVTPGGSTGNGGSFNPAISADADAIAFRSEASNLVPGDTNARWDIFVRVRTAGTTARVSVASDGTQGNHHSMEASVSDDGRFVAFRSMASNLVTDDDNRRADIFVHDRDTAQTVLVSRSAADPSDGHSANPAISGDGAWIVFESDATNLVAGDTNDARDIFRAPNPLAGGQ